MIPRNRRLTEPAGGDQEVRRVQRRWLTVALVVVIVGVTLAALLVYFLYIATHQEVEDVLGQSVQR